MPALYIGHGAPTLVDDPVWPVELAAWARDLPRPRSILMVSAHWESQPLTVGATTPVPARVRLLRLPGALLPDSLRRPRRPGARGVRGEADPRRRAGGPGAEPRPRPRRVRAADGDVPGRGHPGPPDVAPRPGPGAPLRHRAPAGAAARRGRAHRRQRLPDPRPALRAGVHGGQGGRADLVDRLRPLGRRDAGGRRRRHPLRLPEPRPGHAVRAPDRGALRAALRDARARPPPPTKRPTSGSTATGTASPSARSPSAEGRRRLRRRGRVRLQCLASTRGRGPSEAPARAQPCDGRPCPPSRATGA